MVPQLCPLWALPSEHVSNGVRNDASYSISQDAALTISTLLSTRDLGCSGGCLGCLQTLPYVTTGVGAADPKTQAGRYVESLCSTSFLSFLGMCRILLMRILKCTETHWFPVSWTAGAVCSFGGLINNYAVLQSHTDGMVTWVVFWVSCVLYTFVHRMPKISAVF